MITLMEAGEKVEQIRTTSTNIHQVILSLKDLWKELGITVVFTSYPSRFDADISNSHDAPLNYPTNFIRDILKPLYYPGWEGYWEGTVFGNNLNFRSLIEGDKKFNLPSIHWIKTGTGSPGQSFRISGTLFLYDFPLIEESYKSAYTDHDSIKKTFKAVLNHYDKHYSQALYSYINTQQQTVTLKELAAQIKELRVCLEDKENKSKAYLTSEFNKQYNAPLPVPPLSFIDDEKVRRILTKATYETANPLPELKEVYEKIKKVHQELIQFEKDNLELLI